MTLFIFGFAINLTISCAEKNSREKGIQKEVIKARQKYQGVTIEVDISNKNWLSILLAYDGTINRKGGRVFNPEDKDFFIGVVNNNAFDSLMNEMSVGLLPYCNSISPKCDTLNQTCKAKISFGNTTTSCDVQYCVNGTLENLPKPIKDFIEKSIKVTEHWYQEQKKMVHNK